MIIFAMDLSLTASGYAIAVDGKVDRSGVVPGRGVGMARMIAMRNEVMSHVDAVKPHFVVMEDFAFSRNMSMAREVTGNAYLIRAELFTDNIPLVVVTPTSLKKFCVGTAGSKKEKIGKEHILLNLFKRFGHDVSSHDEADAIVLAYVGMALAGEWEPKIDAQREVLATVRASKMNDAKFLQGLQERKDVEKC